MNRRQLLGSAAALSVVTLAACATAPTPATVSAAAQAAATAVQGIIADVQAMVASRSLDPASLSDIGALIAQMQAQVTLLLTPVAPAAATQVSTVLTTITNILQQAAIYLPAILPIIAMFGSTPTKLAAAPKAYSPAQASLQSHFAALRAAAS